MLRRWIVVVLAILVLRLLLHWLLFQGQEVVPGVIARPLGLCDVDRPRLCATKCSTLAADRIFLRKVGGGYIFICRVSMEYFAALETEPSAGRSVQSPHLGAQ